MPAMHATTVRLTPVPIVVLEHQISAGYRDPGDKSLIELVEREIGPLARTLRLGGCRAVSMDRLEHVLEHGVDVSPTSAVIYVDFLSKALEYGGQEKLILSYDQAQLEPTFREVATNTPAEELAHLSGRFPTRLTSEDGEMYWYSRLDPADRRIASPYEVAYARWIPGDPWRALRCLLILGPAEVRLVARVEEAIGNVPEVNSKNSSAGAA